MAVKKSSVTRTYRIRVLTEDGSTNLDSKDAQHHNFDAASKSGVDNPKYKQQIRDVVQAGTDFTAWRMHFTPMIWAYTAEVKQHSTQPWKIAYYTGKGIHNFIPTQVIYVPGADLTKANNEALTHLVRNIRDVQTAFQGGVFLGEVAQVVRMLRRPAKALREGFDSYLDATKRYRQVRNRVARLRAVTDTWLEYQYGWRPLIHDIEDAKEALRRSFSVIPHKVVRGYGEHSASQRLSGHSAYGTMSPQVVFSSVQKSTYRVIYKAAVGIEHPHELSREQVGLTLSDFVPTLWELIPYSFAVDYFTNIGEMLSAASLARGATRWIMKTVIEENEIFSETPYLTTTSSVKQTSFKASQGRGTFRKVTRTKYDGTLVPSITFELPGSGTKWINLSALVLRHRKVARLLIGNGRNSLTYHP